MNSLTAPLAANLQSRRLALRSRIEDKRIDLATREEEGANTVEYIAGTVAALALAACLIALYTTGFVPHFIENFIHNMLNKFLKV